MKKKKLRTLHDTLYNQHELNCNFPFSCFAIYQTRNFFNFVKPMQFLIKKKMEIFDREVEKEVHSFAYLTWMYWDVINTEILGFGGEDLEIKSQTI